VCTGNICRSPFAHWLFQKRIHENGWIDVQVDSAGVLALPGNHATSMARKVAWEEHAVDLSKHRAKVVTKALISWSDLVLVMEKTQERDLLHTFPHAEGKLLLLRYFARSGSRRRGIADPYGLNHEAYRFCFLDIEEAVSGLTAYLEGTTRIFKPVQVSCYEGYRAQENPRSFVQDGKRHDITDVVDRWYDSPLGKRGKIVDYYKVQTKDGYFFLRYDRERDIWGIQES
jgi:protein-tyrosine phosphatase